MSDEDRIERLEKMVDLISGATIRGCAFAPVLADNELRELARLRLELYASKVEDTVMLYGVDRSGGEEKSP